jgi:predicted mannosyl-3-phosphoglycerate phosphatase (HAD superfamily)
MLDNQFRRAERQLARQSGGVHIEQLRRRITEEYESFREAVAAWTQVREQWLHEAKRAMSERCALLQSRLKELEYGLRLQSRRMRELSAQLG